MALGCFTMALSNNIYLLFFGFFIIRLSGQGAFGLTVTTLLIKKFNRNRGKAIGIMTLGFPLSEIIYPLIALNLLEHIGWRQSYFIFGLSNIILILPLQLFLINKSNLINDDLLEGESFPIKKNISGLIQDSKITRDWTLKEVLHDTKFYLMIICSCLPPMVVTGIFFHQETLFNHHGWPITSVGIAFGFYALCKTTGSLFIGNFVDKHGPLIPFITLIMLLSLGTFLAGLGGEKEIIFLYFSIIGISLGFSSPVTNVMWSRLYGTKHIGRIKGTISTFRNGVTAFSPLFIAIMLDQEIPISMILKKSAFIIFIIGFIPILVWNKERIDRRI